MASHRRPKQPGRTRITVLSTAAAAAVALSAQAAQAAPGRKPGKDEVKAAVDRLYEQAEQATEKYNGANEERQRLQKDLSSIQDRVARCQQELNAMRNGLGSLASAQYRSGGIDASVQLFLSSAPDDYLDKAARLDQLGGRQVAALKEIQDKQREIIQARAKASGRLKDLATARTELNRKKQEVQGKLAEAQRLLDTLTAKEKSALADEQQRAGRAATEQVRLGNDTAASGRAAAAFAAARSQLGKPYLRGGTGLATYDCSGLTSWAYARADVHLPRTSEEQAGVGTRLTRSQLQVGDLVFFFNDLHHVGLYAGNGQILHAPRTGTVVRYESMETIGGPFMFGVRV